MQWCSFEDQDFFKPNKNKNSVLSGQNRFCEIHLAVKVLTSADRLRDTLIHEMCHAASWILNDIRDGHGPVFKSWGKCAVNAFPELPLITRCHNYVINYKFAFICQDCNHQYKRHSKSINPEKQRCGKCAKNGQFFDKNSNAGKLVLHIHGMFIIFANTQKSLTNIGKWFSYLYLLYTRNSEIGKKLKSKGNVFNSPKTTTIFSLIPVLNSI